MNKAKNILLGSLIFLTSFAHSTDVEMSIEKKDEVIQSLLEGKIDPCSLNTETISLYVSLIEGHRAVLEHIIAKQTGFSNNIDAIKGVAWGYFGFNWFCQNLLDLIMNYEIRYGAQFELQRMKRFASKYPGMIIVRFALMFMSGKCMKDAYGYLHKAWHTKENTMNDLAKTEEILIVLKSVQHKSL